MQATLPELKISKPGRTELVHRVYSPAAGQYAMAFGVLVPFVLQPPGAEQDIEFTSIWDHAAALLQKDEILDEGWPKPQGEFLAAGHCHPPAGLASQPVSARISVGPLDKRLAVFGLRHASPTGGMSSPQPFERMPITLANAFGGPGHEFNPDGKGMPGGGGEVEFPNIELPDHLMMSGTDRPPVAGFGPLPAAWPERSRHLGAQDQRWRDHRWPHLPEDSDARFFMAAAQDQHLPGFWNGGEPILVQNMHPAFPQLEATVPRSRPRFFVHQSDPGGDAQFLELNVHVDTIWLLPDARLGIMIFRGSIPVGDPDGRDVNAFHAEFEDPDTPPLPIDLYLGNCLKAMSPELFGHLPDTTTPEAKAALESLGEDELVARIREQRDYFEAALQKAGMRDDELLQLLEANPQTRHFAQTILERNKTLTGFFNEIVSLVELIHSDDASPAATSTPPPSLNDALTPYPTPAGQAPRTPPETAQPEALHDASAAARNRQLVVNAQLNGHSCANLDLAHANLAGLDLGGMDFNGAILAGANLAGARLQGADMNGIFAAGARFDAADLAGCRLSQASLGDASFMGAVLRGANLDASDCSNANFSGADLSSASLAAATLAGAWLQGVRAERLIATDARFNHANLDNAQFPAALLDGADLSGASAQRINLEDSTATRINLSQADLRGARLLRAQLGGSQTGPGTSLRKAQLDHATLEDASWTGADLQEASLNGVTAQNTDFSDAMLSGAKLVKSDLRSACFDRAMLEGADLGASNLMQASFIHSDLRHCNFDHSNLYNATFKDPRIAGARFNQANLDRTLLATE